MVVDDAVIDSYVVFHRISILSGPEDAQITIETDDNKKNPGLLYGKIEQEASKETSVLFLQIDAKTSTRLCH